jgi:hypothetical protein
MISSTATKMSSHFNAQFVAANSACDLPFDGKPSCASETNKIEKSFIDGHFQPKTAETTR